MSSSFDFSKRNKFSPSQNNEKKEIGSQQESFVDNRASSNEISQLQSNVNTSINSQEITQLQEKVDNTTGMPNDLKQGIESLSGQDMSDVKVNYNSDKPAQLQAHAYAQGKDIHIAPGQEKHLPHEAWHVAQQKQGRVQPTAQFNGAPINNDNSLESEADKMGQKAAQLQAMEDNHSAQQQTVQKKENNTGVSITQKMSDEYIEAQWALARDNMLSMSITLNRIVQIDGKEGQKFAKANEMAESMAKKLRNDSMGSNTDGGTRLDLKACYGNISQNLQESLKLESASDLYNSSKHGLSPKITELSGLVVANIEEGIWPAINAIFKK